MSTNGEAIISIPGVTKRFGGNVVAVDDVSLDVRAGEFFALLGPSGCGKTTLLRMIAGFETPSDGAIQHSRKPWNSGNSCCAWCQCARTRRVHSA